MIKKYMVLRLLISVIFLFLIGFVSCSKSEWPEKPINVFVGWSAGGSSDVTTRALTLEMEKKLGQKILITNVTGAQGSIGSTQVAKAPADGYHWFGGAAVHGTWSILGHTDLSWTNFYAFIDVEMPSTIYVSSDAPWKTIEDLIKDIKARRDGRFKYGHPGAGSNGNIFAGLLLEAAGAADKVTSIPYKGGREAGRYLLSGEINFASVTMGDLTDWAIAGRVRPLANLFSKETVFEGVTFPAITDVYPELEVYQAINPYYGVYLRRDTPEEIVTQVAEAFAYAIEQDGFQKRVIKERAGILSPKLGRASDELMSKIESARGWALHKLGIAHHNPAKFGVPKLSQWSWPPHERAANLRAWPQAVEIRYEKFH